MDPVVLPRSTSGIVGVAGGFFAFEEGLFEEVFDLAVDAAEFVLGPVFEFLPKAGIDAEEEGFAGFGGH